MAEANQAKPNEPTEEGVARDQEPHEARARVIPVSIPAGALSAERARALEQLFLTRFQQRFERFRRVTSPLDGNAYAAGPRERDLFRHNRAAKLIEIMKRNRIYERELLEELPLDESAEYRIFRKSLFGRKGERLVVAARCISPFEELVRLRCATEPAGPLDVDRAVSAIVRDPEVFHYIGLMAVAGWEDGIELHIPSAPHLLVALVEPGKGTAWHIRYRQDPRWGEIPRLYDPESEREKAERAIAYLRQHPELSLRGGHVLLVPLAEELGVSDELMRTAVDELISQDPELSLLEIGGREVLKRRRI